MANGNIITARFRANATSARVRGLWQWDYGQILQLIGIKGLPAATEVHFEQDGIEIIVLGTTSNDICSVNIPNVMLKRSDEITAYVYLHSGDANGETEYIVYLPIYERAQPIRYCDNPETEGSYSALVQATNLLQSDITAVNEYVEQAKAYAEAAAESGGAKRWADIEDKPTINGVALEGDMNLADFGVATLAYNTTAYWDNSLDLISERNKIYVYTDHDEIDGQPIAGFKLGDGTSYVVDLPFLDERMVQHINDNVVHISAEERDKLDNTVTATVAGEQLIFI